MMTAAEIADRHNSSLKRATPGVGHNSGVQQSTHKIAKAQLQSFVERIERLEEEKKAISDDIRDVIKEAKSNGYDAKALRSIVRLRKQDPDERAEQQAVLDTYKLVLGLD